MNKRGSVVLNEKTGKFGIDWKTTNSYIAAVLQLESVLSAREYAKGLLLDVGCGSKPFLYVFKDKVKRHIGIDMPTTRHLNKEIDVFSSAADMPFKDSSFDTILTTSVLEHVKEPQKMFDEMHRVLRKGSYLILTTPCEYGLHEQPYDFFRCTKYSLKMMSEKSGFKIVYIKPVGGMLAILNHLIAKYLSISLYSILEKLRGNKLDKKSGFAQIKKNILIQFVSFVPQKLFLILYNLGLRKIDELSAEVDPFMYVMVVKK